VLNAQATSWVAQHMRKPSERVHLIPNGVDTHHFRPPTPAERQAARNGFGLVDGDVAGFFVGRLHERKGADRMVELASALQQVGRDRARLNLVGEGPLLPPIQAEIGAQGLQDTIRVFGWSDPRVAYWAADLVLMPSRVEGFPLVAAEAMACACPVLMTRVGAFEMLIDEGVTGFSCPPDTKAFVEAASAALLNFEGLQCVRTAARRRSEAYDLRVQMGKTMRAYRSFLTGPHAPVFGGRVV